MKPFPAIFLIVFSLNVELINAAYKVSLGSRLIRGLSPKTLSKLSKIESKSGQQENDTVSEDMKKQMKRIDALEDIFIGSSAGSGGKKKNTAESTRRSSVDDTKELDKELSAISDDEDFDGDVEKTLKLRSEKNLRRRRDVSKDKPEKKKDKKNSTKAEDDADLEQELADDQGAGYSTKNDSVTSSEKSTVPGSDNLMEDDQETGYSNKNESLSNSKKSTIPRNNKLMDTKETKSDSDLMGGAGAISDDQDLDDDSKYQDGDGDEKSDEESSEKGDEEFSKKDDVDDKSEKGEKFEDDDKSENDDDSESEEVDDDGYENSDEDTKSEKSKDNEDDDKETDNSEEKSTIKEKSNGDDDDDESDNQKPSSDDETADKKSDIKDDKDTTGTKLSTKPSCRTECSTPMDYETCAVPRCDYKVGTIKDLCQYLCRHQKEQCNEVCE